MKLPPEEVQGLNQRLSSYRNLWSSGGNVAGGGRLLAVIHAEGQLKEDLATLFAMAPQLLDEYLHLAERVDRYRVAV